MPLKSASIKLNITNETSQLEAVVLGLGTNSRRQQLNQNTTASIARLSPIPLEPYLHEEIGVFEKVLLEHNVTIYRPQNIPHVDQIFPRDVAFVVGSQLVQANMVQPRRKIEYLAIRPVLANLPESQILVPPDEAVIEGGDVILKDEFIFVGLGKRTNCAGYKYLRHTFRDKEVIPLELNGADILHLDCAFQPVGPEYAIICEACFACRPDPIYDLFGENNLIKIPSQAKNQLHPNIFSISPSVVISEPKFGHLNQELRKRGLTVTEVSYTEVSKMRGLFRCCTLPLRRTK